MGGAPAEGLGGPERPGAKRQERKIGPRAEADNGRSPRRGLGRAVIE